MPFKNPDLKLDAPDFSAKTWVALKSRKDRVLPEVRDGWNYSPRKDGTGRSVPNICFKVPTGGGKTLLAAASVSRIFGKFLRSNQGFVLWIGDAGKPAYDFLSHKSMNSLTVDGPCPA